MRAHIDRTSTWQSRMVRVWLFDEMPDGLRVLRVEGKDAWSWEATPRNVASDPTFEIPEDALAAIVEAAGDALPPSGQMAEHLKDTRLVRDRLLTLVEAVVEPQRDSVQ